MPFRLESFILYLSTVILGFLKNNQYGIETMYKLKLVIVMLLSNGVLQASDSKASIRDQISFNTRNLSAIKELHKKITTYRQETIAKGYSTIIHDNHLKNFNYVIDQLTQKNKRLTELLDTK
jgi:hypothetical protein